MKHYYLKHTEKNAIHLEHTHTKELYPQISNDDKVGVVPAVRANLLAVCAGSIEKIRFKNHLTSSLRLENLDFTGSKQSDP